MRFSSKGVVNAPNLWWIHRRQLTDEGQCSSSGSIKIKLDGCVKVSVAAALKIKFNGCVLVGTRMLS